MLYYIGPVATFFIAAALTMYIKKKYPWVRPHHEFGVLALAVIVISFFIQLTMVPMVDKLYADFGAVTPYLISPSILLLASVILFGLLSFLSFFSKPFQAKFDAIFANKWAAMALGLVLTGVFSAFYVFVVYFPIYNVSSYI